MSEADVMRRLVAGELYVEAWGVRDAPALLYLHGGPGQGCYEFVEHQAARLSDKIRVVALDQRGVLRSAALPPQGTLTIADLIADCETVRTHLEIENWTVLGQSFGGMVALRYAIEHPVSVTGVIFENPCWDVARTCRSVLSAFVAHRTAVSHPAGAARAAQILRTEADARALWAMLLDVLREFGQDRHELYIPDQDTRQRIADMLVAAPFTADQWGKGGDHLARLTQDDDFYQDHTPLLQQMQQPAVLIKGERDPIPSAEEVCDFRHALPHAEVRTYHCGHFVQAEKQLEYTRLVSDFVLGHGKRPKSQTLPSRTS